MRSRLDPRRNTPSIGIYSHVKDRWGIFYAQPFVLNERQAGVAIEGFQSLPDDAIDRLLTKATENLGRDLVNEHIKSKSGGKVDLNAVELERILDGFSAETKTLLGIASKTKGNGWFKSVTAFQEVAKDVVGPHLAAADPDFQELINKLRSWIHAA